MVPLQGEHTAATMSCLWYLVVISTLTFANRSPTVTGSIFGACQGSVEMVSENPVTKATLVSLSISALSNLANPINNQILFTKTSTRLLAHLTMVSFLYAVNVSSVKASFSWAVICSAYSLSLCKGLVHLPPSIIVAS